MSLRYVVRITLLPCMLVSSAFGNTTESASKQHAIPLQAIHLHALILTTMAGDGMVLRPAELHPVNKPLPR